MLHAGVLSGGVLDERMPKSAIRQDLRRGLVVGMGVGVSRVMRRACRGTGRSLALRGLNVTSLFFDGL